MKIINFIKKNWPLFLLTLVGLLVCIFTFKVEIDARELHPLLGKWKYLVFFVIFCLVLIFSYAVYIVYKKKIKIEKLFLIFIIPIGMLYMIVIPLGRVPDENSHFYRAYEISIGNIISPKDKNGYGGDYLPSNINKSFNGKSNYSEQLEKINIKLSKEKEFVSFTNTALYSFITYLPQVVGITIARILNLPIFWIGMFGRLTNFLVWLMLMYFSIKYIPFKKLSLLIVMFLPMMLQEAASMSADALTNASVFFFVSYILYLRYGNEKKISRKSVIILSIVAVVISVCKIVYLPFCLFVFLLPERKFKSKKCKYVYILLLAILVVIISGIFFLLTLGYNAHVEVPDIAEFDTVLQLKNIFHNPIGYVVVMFRTVYKCINSFVVGFIGEGLCWYDVQTSSVFVRIISIILIIMTILDSTKVKTTEKVCCFIVVFSVILLIFTSEYLTWTKVGDLIISGIQGRYFIPLVIPSLLLFNFTNLKYDLDKIYKYLLMIMIYINISVLITLFVAHI